MKKGKKPIAILIWSVLCLAVLGASTYPFLNDYFLAKKQEAEESKTEKKGSKY